MSGTITCGHDSNAKFKIFILAYSVKSQFNFLQFLKADGRIRTCDVLSKLTVCRFWHSAKAYSSIDKSPSGNVILFKLLQCSKTPALMFIILLGIVNSFKFLHAINAATPMSVSVSGSLVILIAEAINAPSPIFVSVLGNSEILTSVKRKASSSIVSKKEAVLKASISYNFQRHFH